MRERESRVWGIDAFRERERRGQGEREIEWERRGAQRKGKAQREKMEMTYINGGL
jgi:hypothetical protein